MRARMDNNKLVSSEAKTFHFHFDMLKDVDKNFKHEIDHIIIHNRFLAVQRIKIEINKLLYKYKHGIDIHEQKKQQKIQTT